MTTVFRAWLHGRFIEMQSNLTRKKLHRTNQGFHPLGGRISNRDRDLRGSVHFRREIQPQHLKRWFFLRKRPIHFHINSTSIIGPVKRNQFSFSSIEISEGGRYVYFVVIEINKKNIYNIIIELWKTIKKSMVTVIAQKSYAAWFPLWSLRKNDISKMK